MRSPVLATALLLATAAIPAGASAQESEWVLEVGDPVGDVSDNADEIDHAPQPYTAPGYVDITALQVEADGDQLDVTFEVADDVPTIEVYTTFEYMLTIDWEGHKGFYARVFPTHGNVEYADLSQLRWEPEPRPIRVEGNRVSFRVPTRRLGPPADLRFHMYSEAYDERDFYLAAGFDEDGNPPEDFDPSVLFEEPPKSIDEPWGFFTRAVWSRDTLPDDRGQSISFPPAIKSVAGTRPNKGVTFAKATKSITGLLEGGQTGPAYTALVGSLDEAWTATTLTDAVTACRQDAERCPVVAGQLLWLARQSAPVGDLTVVQRLRERLHRASKQVRSASVNAGAEREPFDRAMLAEVHRLEGRSVAALLDDDPEAAAAVQPEEDAAAG